jgi:hypothetical protein
MNPDRLYADQPEMINQEAMKPGTKTILGLLASCSILTFVVIPRPFDASCFPILRSDVPNVAALGRWNSSTLISA